MAHASKRTSALLGSLALVFIIIIIILCIVSKGGSPPHYTSQGEQKSKEITGVYTDTSTAAPTTTTSMPTTTTTTSTTTAPTTTSPTTTTTASTTTTPEATIVMTTPMTTHQPTTTTTTTITTSTTSESSSTSTTHEPTISEPTTLATTDDMYFSTNATESSTSPATTNDTVYDDEFTLFSTTDDSPFNDTTLDDSLTSDTTLSTTDDSLSNDTTLDDSLASDTTLSTTDDSLSNDTTLDDSLASDTTFSTTDDSLSNGTTFEDYFFNETTLLTTDSDLNDTTSESTTLSTTHQPTTTPLATTTSTEQPTSTTTTTTAETTEKESTSAPTATTTSPSCSVQETCKTPACKTVAANMLAMMDHKGVDPCQDFYQYACGGLMQNPFLDARDHHVISKRLIKGQLETTDPDDTTMGKMRMFYDSCLNSVDQDVTEGWKQTVREVFGEHRFAHPSVSGVAPLNLTNILAHMMLHDFAPFFDMSVDVSGDDNDAFSLTLHPVVPGSPFSEDLARKVCLEEHHRKLENLEGTNSYDVEEEYKIFTDCVLTGNGLMARLERMEEAVRRFGLLDHLGDSAMAKHVLQDTKSKAESLLLNLAAELPRVPELKQDLANKNFIVQPLEILNHDVIDWKVFVQQLMTGKDISNVKVQQYLGDSITGILNVLRRHNTDDPIALSNVLLMLWSEKLYTDFVKPLGSNVGEHEYCLHAAITLMQDAASHLYMDSLSDDEINARTTQVTNISSSIKRAGKRELERSGKEEQQVQKLEYMLSNVITADGSEIVDTIENSAEQLNITSDFFDNCIQLLRNRRRLTYDTYSDFTKEKPLRFMQPYNPFGVHVYAMSIIMIPFAAQEDSRTFENIPSYLSYAGIGHMISHLVMHGYDTSGVHYQSKGSKLLVGYEYYMKQKTGLQEQYRAEQQYKSPNGVTANINMSTLALNELLADSGAARLAWEAYLMRNELDPTNAPVPMQPYNSVASRRRRHSPLDMTGRTKREVADPLISLDSEEKPLPWLGLSPIQLYFLHWSQHHCSASGGMSLLELTESKQPPARMRVNLVLQNEPLFNKAFQCTPKTKETPFILG